MNTISDADIKWHMRHIEPHLKDADAAVETLLAGVRKCIEKDARLRGEAAQGEQQAVAWQPIGTAPDNELVMVAIDKPGYSGMMFATYRDHQWYADDRDQTPFGGWTHWCPLPPMPSAALSTQPAPSEQVAASVAVPEGLIYRVEEAARRIDNGHAPRRIPADPTDVDLVLGEVLAWLKGEPAPFWVPAAAPVAPERGVRP